jgi:ABC-type sugar transport system permease subunit
LKNSTTSKGASTKPSRGLQWLNKQEQVTGFLYILPAFIIIFLFGLFPIGYSFYMSLFNWRVRKGSFVGLGHYIDIFGDIWGLLMFLAGVGLLALAYWFWTKAFKSMSLGKLITRLIAAVVLVIAGFILSSGWGRMVAAGNADFLNSLIITLYYAIGTVPAEIILGMILAYILFQDIKGKEVFRMVYFLPYITPTVTTAVVFQIIFSSRETSIANMVMTVLGMDPLKWRFEPRPLTQLLGLNLEGFLAGPSLALVTIIIFGIWTYVGYNAVIFLAGLGNIPQEIYEAAEIDGANRFHMFRHITMPLLSPVTFYLSLVAFIGTFKAFNHIYVLRVPSAQDSVITASIRIFDSFYKANMYGVATAQAIVLFIVILGLTFVQNKIMGERVFYG